MVYQLKVTHLRQNISTFDVTFLLALRAAFSGNPPYSIKFVFERRIV